MQLPDFPFQLINWTDVPAEKHNGISGFATWKIKLVGTIRIRLVEYSANYKADHWCAKGHIIYCIEGEMKTELKDGKTYNLQKGMSYILGDKNEPHASSSLRGCILFIVD